VLDLKNNRLIGVREDHTDPSPSAVKNSWHKLPAIQDSFRKRNCSWALS
jgi:hypothetical protein